MFDEDEVVRVYVPPGWPGGVRPPGADGWVRTATVFLLDVCPSEYRGYAVMTRHPVILARCAKAYVGSQIQATRDSVATLQREEARLLRVARAVDLVEQALRDVRFVPRL